MANAVGVCTENFLSSATVVESSEKAVYPASNVLDLQQRRKVWRTDGYWLIESGSNEIIFREAVGVDLTATIAPGEFTTATLAAAIKAALEGAGLATYTVTYLAQGKFRISSNVGGGATVFQLRMEHASSADMAEILGFDAVAYTGLTEYTADVVRLHTHEWLQFDLSIPTNPKAFCLVGDRNRALRISPTATIKLQANPTNSWASPAFEIDIPFADAALAVWDFEGLAPSPYRYWRFLIIDKENSRLYLEFGAAFLGDTFNFSRGCAVFPIQQRGIDNSTIVVSEGGQIFAQKKPKSMGIQLQWRGLLKEEEEEMLRHWENVGLTDNFFLILDAGGAFSSTKEERVKLVRFEQAYQDELGNPNNFSSSWNLVEAI